MQVHGPGDVLKICDNWDVDARGARGWFHGGQLFERTTPDSKGSHDRELARFQPSNYLSADQSAEKS
jgi:hypothetical protein